MQLHKPLNPDVIQTWNILGIVRIPWLRVHYPSARICVNPPNGTYAEVTPLLWQETPDVMQDIDLLWVQI